MLFELSTEFDEPYQFRSAVYDLPVMVKDPGQGFVPSVPAYLEALHG